MAGKRKLFPEYCKTASLCQAYDLSPSGLRYLEEKGLIEPDRDPDSRYRTYGMTEFTRLFMHRIWRQYGFTADESFELILHTPPQKEVLALSRRSGAIEQEIRILESRLRRLQETENALLRLANSDAPVLSMRPPMLRLTLVPNRRSTLYENLDDFRKWYNALPLTAASMLLQTDDNSRIDCVSLGFVVAPEDARMLGLSDSPHVTDLPPVLCLTAALRFRDDLEDLEARLRPLYSQLHSRHLHPVGPAVTVLLAMTDLGSGPERVDQVWIPVEEDTSCPVLDSSEG